MKNLGPQVEKLIKKVGEPVKINRPGRAYGAGDKTVLSTNAIVESKSVSIGDGKWDNALTATLPATERDLNGATLTRVRTGEKYTIKAYQKDYAFGYVTSQEVILT